MRYELNPFVNTFTVWLKFDLFSVKMTYEVRQFYGVGEQSTVTERGRYADHHAASCGFIEHFQDHELIQHV